MALNPKFLEPEKTAIQCHGKQSELDVFKSAIPAKIIQTYFGHKYFS